MPEYSEATKQMLQRLPGTMSDADVVKQCMEGIDSGTMGVSNRTGKQMSKEYLLNMLPVVSHYIDGTPQKIQIGKAAPNGPVFHPDGSKSSLHDQIRALGANGQPRALTLLNFGSFTWPPYTYKLPVIAEMTEKHVQSGLLSVLNVYIREAHPTDEWSLDINDKVNICVAQTKTLPERLAAAASFRAFPGFKDTPAEKILTPGSLVVDDPGTRELDHAYEAVPERLVLVDKNFNVVYRSGQGPFQYDQQGMLAAVEAYAAKQPAPALAASPASAKL